MHWVLLVLVGATACASPRAEDERVGPSAGSEAVGARFVIGPGHERLFMRLLTPPNLPPPCVLSSANVEQDHVLAHYECESSETVRLVHPSVGGAAPRSDRFAVECGRADLRTRIIASLVSGENAFEWVDLQPPPAVEERASLDARTSDVAPTQTFDWPPMLALLAVICVAMAARRRGPGRATVDRTSLTAAGVVGLIAFAISEWFWLHSPCSSTRPSSSSQ